MATYQIGYYAFNQVSVTNVSGQGGIQLTTPGNTQGIGTPGERFQLNTTTPNVSTLVVEDDDLNMTDASVSEAGAAPEIHPDSPFGLPGQRVDLEYRITVVTNEVPPRTLTFYVVSVGGNNVGLIGSEPLLPNVTYTITEAIDQQSSTTLRRYGVNGQIGNDITGQNSIAWDALACFTFGTQIDTPDGQRLIEDLEIGDLITTLDNGSQPLRWLGRRRVSKAQMLAQPELRPILFEADAIGNRRALMVSPQHRMLLNDWRAEVYFGEEQVLIAAKSMVNGTSIRQVLPEEGVVYCHLLFDRHEVILAEGALSESFHPGEVALCGLDEDQRREIEALFPQLALDRRRAAFPIVRPAEARALLL